jgi:hypothetical protein
MQLRFASFAVVNLWEDFHLQDRAHAGRTTTSPAGAGPVMVRNQLLLAAREAESGEAEAE